MITPIVAYLPKCAEGAHLEARSSPNERGSSLPITKIIRLIQDILQSLTLSCPYSPECVEGRFCELRLYGVLRGSRRNFASGIICIGVRISTRWGARERKGG